MLVDLYKYQERCLATIPFVFDLVNVLPEIKSNSGALGSKGALGNTGSTGALGIVRCNI